MSPIDQVPVEGGLVCSKGKPGLYKGKSGHKKLGCVKSVRVRKTKSGKCPKGSYKSRNGSCKRKVSAGAPKKYSVRRRPHNYHTPMGYVKRSSSARPYAYMPDSEGN